MILQLSLLYLAQLIACALVISILPVVLRPLAKPSSKPSGSNSDVLTYESFLTGVRKLQEQNLYGDWMPELNWSHCRIPELTTTPQIISQEAMVDYSSRNSPATPNLFTAQEVVWASRLGENIGRRIDREIMEEAIPFDGEL